MGRERKSGQNKLLKTDIRMASGKNRRKFDRSNI